MFTLDINECLSNNGNCSQLCKNENGKHRCECFGGYLMTDDGRSCIGELNLIINWVTIVSKISGTF